MSSTVEFNQTFITDTFDEQRLKNNNNFSAISDLFNSILKLVDIDNYTIQDIKSLIINDATTTNGEININGTSSTLTADNITARKTLAATTAIFNNKADNLSLTVERGNVQFGQGENKSQLTINGSTIQNGMICHNNYNEYIINSSNNIPLSNYYTDGNTVYIINSVGTTNIILNMSAYNSAGSGVETVNSLRLIAPASSQNGQILKLIFNNLPANSSFNLQANNILTYCPNETFTGFIINKNYSTIDLMAYGDKWIVMNYQGVTFNS